MRESQVVYLHSQRQSQSVALLIAYDSITTWDQLQEKFLLKFFHASKTLALKKEILAVSQKPREAFHETWDRFGELFMVSTSRPKCNYQKQCECFCRRISNGKDN